MRSLVNNNNYQLLQTRSALGGQGMGKVLIPIKEGEKSHKEPGQGHLGWAEVGSRSGGVRVQL